MLRRVISSLYNSHAIANATHTTLRRFNTRLITSPLSTSSSFSRSLSTISSPPQNSKNIYSNNNCNISIRRRSYHSYPDPNEKPIVTTNRSETPKTIDKSNGLFALHPKFRLDKTFPGVPVSTGISKQEPPQTMATKLPNGLTIATQEMPGLMSSFAFMIGAGSANEIQIENHAGYNKGVTHILELSSFKSTQNRSTQEFIAAIEKLGGVIQCISTRESVMYCVDVLRENLEPAMDLLADTVLNPLLSEEEVKESTAIAVLQEEQWPSDVLSRDAVQLAAFPGSPLGNTHFCPADKAGNVNATMIRKFREKYMFGENCFISGAGVDHEHFVKLVESRFGSKIPSGGVNAQELRKRPKSAYTGGMVKSERPLSENMFVKIAIAFEIGGWSDDKLVAACVLQQLLGGGSSFSAGGPGKGMYTRLYREILNENYWVESAESFLSIHEDSGTLGIDGACAPEHVSNLVGVILDQLVRLENELVTEEELSRAKNMLKSMLMMQLESRLVLCEDIARQYVTFGKREAPQEVCKKIDAITAEDLREVAKHMLKSQPSIGCVGVDLSKVPTYESIQSYTDMLKKRMSLFGSGRPEGKH